MTSPASRELRSERQHNRKRRGPLQALRTEFAAHKAQFRFCLRLTLATLLAFTLAQFWHFPLRGLWAVLTAIVVTQASTGGSLLAVTEYAVGTLAGAIYASAVAVLIPHTTSLELGGVLVLSVAPLALASGLNPMFRVAPFTAAFVLFISTEFAQSPIESALYRVLEVLIGGMSVVIISLLVLPERAHERGLKAAASILERLATVLPQLLVGFSRPWGARGTVQIQDSLGEAIAHFQAVTADAKRERMTAFQHELDLSSLSRTLLRLRHDYVILGRSASAPLPEPLLSRLDPLLTRIGETGGDYLHGAAAALAKRDAPPSLQTAEAALQAYAVEFALVRQEGLTQALSSQEVERVFALGFALEQLHRNLSDLQRCVEECADASTQGAKARA